MSSVVAAQPGLRHVYIPDFAREIDTHVASVATGPWSDGPSLGACDLPSDDPHAVCAAPIVHEELADPTRSDEFAITYGVGSTGPHTGAADDYWPRLVWVR
jgi:hypothetical protein